MRKTITTEQAFCDVCNSETDVTTVNYPVIFHTDQTEGRGCKPYISQEKIDVCENCKVKILKLDGWGAQGHNQYEVKKGE